MRCLCALYMINVPRICFRGTFREIAWQVLVRAALSVWHASSCTASSLIRLRPWIDAEQYFSCVLYQTGTTDASQNIRTPSFERVWNGSEILKKIQTWRWISRTSLEHQTRPCIGRKLLSLHGDWIMTVKTKETIIYLSSTSRHATRSCWVLHMSSEAFLLFNFPPQRVAAHIWNGTRNMWSLVYLGHFNHLIIDQNTVYSSSNVTESMQVFDEHLNEALMETRKNIIVGERYSIPLKTAHRSFSGSR